jgi:hypothetical protein
MASVPAGKCEGAHSPTRHLHCSQLKVSKRERAPTGFDSRARFLCPAKWALFAGGTLPRIIPFTSRVPRIAPHPAELKGSNHKQSFGLVKQTIIATGKAEVTFLELICCRASG